MPTWSQTALRSVIGSLQSEGRNTHYFSPDLSCNMREMSDEHVNKVKNMIFIGGGFSLEGVFKQNLSVSGLPVGAELEIPQEDSEDFGGSSTSFRKVHFIFISSTYLPHQLFLSCLFCLYFQGHRQF